MIFSGFSAFFLAHWPWADQFKSTWLLVRPCIMDYLLFVWPAQGQKKRKRETTEKHKAFVENEKSMEKLSPVHGWTSSHLLVVWPAQDSKNGKNGKPEKTHRFCRK